MVNLKNTTLSLLLLTFLISCGNTTEKKKVILEGGDIIEDLLTRKRYEIKYVGEFQYVYESAEFWKGLNHKVGEEFGYTYSNPIIMFNFSPLDSVQNREVFLIEGDIRRGETMYGEYYYQTYDFHTFDEIGRKFIKVN